MESNINYIWGLLIRNIEWSRKIIQPGCSPGMGLKIREKNSINFSLPSTPSLPFIIDSTRGLMMRSDLSGWEDSLEGRPGRRDRCCLCWRAEWPGLTGAGCQSHRRPWGGRWCWVTDNPLGHPLTTEATKTLSSRQIFLMIQTWVASPEDWKIIWDKKDEFLNLLLPPRPTPLTVSLSHVSR